MAQGVKADGTVKVRAVDHLSWSHARNVGRKRTRKEVKNGSVNGHYQPTCPITHDHLDDLLSAMQLQTSLCDEVPWLWKADVDAAFRRVPLCEAHKWAAGVAYLYKGEPWVATHLGMPFGATSSVVAWHRIGELITALARKLLHLPVFRYVDDWFGADKPGCAEHAMGCMARLVRALLGESSVAD